MSRRRQQRAGNAHQGSLDPARLVFIDETWAKTNMTRLRVGRRAATGFSPKSHRGIGAR